MTIVDERGRLFGRINLVDGAVLIFLAGLVVAGYGSYLLFRPTAPTIESVTAVDLTKEELRIASGTVIAAKLKVRGTGFNPLLRAHVGPSPALAFVFENPNSADVLVGDLPPGSYDLVLFDGIQAVARANGAVTVRHSQGTELRAVGRLVGLSDAQVKTLQPGYKSGDASRGGFEVVAVGEPRRAHDVLRVGDRAIEVPSAASERPAVLLVRCDGTGLDCSIGGVSLRQPTPVAITLDGGVSFVVDELLPSAEPSRATVQVRFTGPQVSLIQTGDQDALIDPRSARITSIGARDGQSVTATVELGADSSSTGWSYRGNPLRPGATFRLVTDRYEAEGVIARLDVAETPAR